MTNRISRTVLAGVTLLLHLLTAEVSAQPLVVTPGSEPAATLKAAVRFRNFSSAGTENEIWIGTPPLAPPPVSAGADVQWDLGLVVSVSYRPDTGMLTTQARLDDFGPPDSVASVEKFIGNVGPLNYIEITIATQEPEAHIFLSGVLYPPGSDSSGCPGCLVAGFAGYGPATSKWKAIGVDLTEGFAFSGRVAASYFMPAGAADSVEIAFGYLPPPDTAGPQIANLSIGPMPLLLNGTATLTATASDSSPWNTGVDSAVYTLNGNTAPLSAVDGAFDEASEDVAVTFPLTQLGVNEVCVHATDALNNTGPASCQQFIVSYKFTGFLSPVENMSVNGAVAGQNIPVRWRLTDANDIPVSDLQAVQQLVSYQINCTDLGGQTVDSIQEYAGGSNGLLYLGDGKWQFNWNTPTSYAGSCRAMYIPFGNGATSPIVTFAFK